MHEVVHELGHSFNIIMGRTPESILNQTFMLIPDFPRRPENASHIHINYGFYGPADQRPWQMHPTGSASEEFADMFIGWVYGKWEGSPNNLTPDGLARMNWMNTYIALTINLVSNK